jgi:hypothetical protein
MLCVDAVQAPQQQAPAGSGRPSHAWSCLVQVRVVDTGCLLLDMPAVAAAPPSQLPLIFCPLALLLPAALVPGGHGPR